MNLTFWHRNQEFKLRLREMEKGRISVGLNGETYLVEVEPVNHEEFLLTIDGRIFDVIVSNNCGGYAVYINGKCIPAEVRPGPPPPWPGSSFHRYSAPNA